ncbi:MAG TPA: methylornithine synthase PylB [Thermoleophilia bacterium]|nr:methylornithine synthase PylB [Thermoleophilia bacterium]
MSTLSRVHEIAARALEGGKPSDDDLRVLLAIDDPALAEPLFAAAGTLTRRSFGDRVALYGFVYFSTYCRNDCSFCLYRRANPQSPRYRKPLSEVVAIAEGLADSGVSLIDLTMGEDPLYFATREFDALVELVRAVKDATGLPVMISPGVVSADVLEALRDAGADWYACYQETHAPAVYARLRMGQDFAERAQARVDAGALGLLVEDGMLLGTGETVAERALTVAAMRDEAVEQVRVMTFVPQRGTPLAQVPRPDTFAELVTIATMRLAMPERLIPASLDVDGIEGLEPRIAAGANVVTSIVPPLTGLAGVSQSELDIDEGLRTAAEVSERLARLELRPTPPDEYAAWVARARTRAPRGRQGQADDAAGCDGRRAAGAP